MDLQNYQVLLGQNVDCFRSCKYKKLLVTILFLCYMFTSGLVDLEGRFSFHFLC